MIAYLDESGDLGFNLDKPGTSRYFVVTLLLCEDTRIVDKIVKKVLRGFSKTDMKHHHGVLHARDDDPSTRRKLLALVAVEDVSVLVVRLDKRQVFTPLEEKHVLYNYVVNILLSRLVSRGVVRPDETIQVIASQRETSRSLNDSFVAYLTARSAERRGPGLTVEIMPARSVKGLQVVDCLSWSFFRKYELGDSTYADIVAEKVIDESSIYG